MERCPEKEGRRRGVEKRTEERRGSTLGKKEMKVPCRARKTGRRGGFLHVLFFLMEKVLLDEGVLMKIYVSAKFLRTIKFRGRNLIVHILASVHLED